MSEIVFTKLTGAGNDFILIDKRKNSSLDITPKLIKNLCDRRFGIGADGLLTIDDVKDLDFEMGYFNSDGSTGMLCGNGARCIIKYADFSGRLNGFKTNFRFQSDIYSGEVLGKNEIRFNLNPPTDIGENIEVRVLDKSFRASFINTGAHHVVIDLAKQKFNELELIEIDKFPVVEYGKAIRYSDQFAPSGTNVNFIFHEKNYIKIRTYERGVEQETLACGTGSVAAAIISNLESGNQTPIKIMTKSGEFLIVDFAGSKNKIRNVSLTGSAKIVFEGKILI